MSEKSHTYPQFPGQETACRVLIVDDNEASAKTMGWTLEFLGNEIRLAHEGLQAIKIAENYLPDIILLDIGLPGMSGYDVCKALRQNPLLKDITIIAQTGWGQKEHLQRSSEARFNYHLLKPVSIDALKEILETLKEKRVKRGSLVEQQSGFDTA